MSQASCCWCSASLVKSGAIWWCGNQTSDACRLRQSRHAQYTTDSHGKLKEWLYVPLPKQTVWHEAVYEPTITRFLIGGAAGPGKSTCIRRILYEFAKVVPGFHAIILRQSIPDLKKSHLRFLPYEVAQLGGLWKEGDKIAVFKHPGGMDAIIRAGHFEDATSIQDHLSAEYDVVAPDEVVTLEQDPTLELFSRARTTNPVMFQLRGLLSDDPEHVLDGSFILAGSNPGGRLWVKDHWITKAPDPEEFPNYNPARWGFYDAKLRDNPYIKGGYVQNLRDLREVRRRQLEDGDWDAFDGALFADFAASRHVGRFEDLYAVA